MSPKVSICVPAYKDKAGIQRLFNSIIKQDYTDIEIIVTDDTPDTSIKDVVDSYDQLNVIYCHNDICTGACDNWNKSLDLANGEYIKIMHQDDFFTFDNSLSEMVKMLDENPDAIMAFCGSRQVTISHDDPFNISKYYDRAIEDTHLKDFEKDYRDLYRGDWVGAPSATIYRNCDARFDPALTWIIDVDFYINLLSSGKKFVCSKEPYISIGVSETQLTNDCIDDGDLNIREYRHVMQKYNLNTVKEYRTKLIQIAIAYKKKYSDISDMGIPKEEYKQETAKHRKYLCSFYINLIKRKLLNGNKD